MGAANDTVDRVDCNPTPAEMALFWKGIRNGGASNQTGYTRLASSVYSYIKDMPLMGVLVSQAMTRGLTALVLVARVHVEYQGVDFVDWGSSRQSRQCSPSCRRPPSWPYLDLFGKQHRGP